MPSLQVVYLSLNFIHRHNHLCSLHVDGIIAASSSIEEVDCFHDFLKSQWEITELKEPNYALSIAIS